MEDTTVISNVADVSTVNMPNYSPGFQAERVTVISNLYTIDGLQDVMLFRWGISFDPPLQKDSREIRNQILAANRQEIRNRLGNFMTSGEVLFCLKTPVLKETRIELSNNQKFKLILKDLEKPVALNTQFKDYELSQRIIQILNSSVRNCFKLLKFVEFGRDSKFYNMAEDNTVDVLGYRLKIRRGFHTSFDFYKGHIPRLLIDTTCRIIRQGSMWDDYCYCSDEGMEDREIFDKYIIGKNFLANYGNYKVYKIARIDQRSTPLSPFPDVAKAKTFKDYFEKQYNKRIEHNNQFMAVAVHLTKKTINGVVEEVEENIYLVPELLLPTGLTDELRNNHQAMALVAEYTRLGPQVRQERNLGIIKAINSIPKSEETLRLRLNPNSNVMKNAGLMLKPPTILLGNGVATLNNNKRIDLSNGGIYTRNATFDKWMILCDSVCELQAKLLAKSFEKVASDIGLKMKPPQIKGLEATKLVSGKKAVKAEDLISVMESSLQTELFFVFLEEPNHYMVYSKIKNYLGYRAGKPSQFFKNWKAKYEDSYTNRDILRNLLVQMCAKQKIPCWRVALPQEIKLKSHNLLMMGADVYHKSMRQSVTSVVSNIDSNMSLTYSQFGFQRRRGDDTLYDIAEKCKKACRVYTAKSGSPPTTIVVLRDGVGESQIAGVLQKEVYTLLQLLKQEFGGKKVGLAYVIVSKRISQKFSVENRGYLTNPDGGLIVDSVATRDNRFEFYATTQFVGPKQGSAKPTHYNLVHNTTDLSANTIYELIYGSCFNYANFTGGIKIPNLVMMANKQALHVGELYSGDGQDVSEQFRYHPAYL
jgi:aubergine